MSKNILKICAFILNSLRQRHYCSSDVQPVDCMRQFQHFISSFSSLFIRCSLSTCMLRSHVALVWGCLNKPTLSSDHAFIFYFNVTGQPFSFVVGLLLRKYSNPFFKLKKAIKLCTHNIYCTSARPGRGIPLMLLLPIKSVS